MTCKRKKQCQWGETCIFFRNTDVVDCGAFLPREMMNSKKVSKEPQTNFQRITQSEEALAEFLDDIPQEIINPLYGVPTKKRALEWLKQESTE